MNEEEEESHSSTQFCPAIPQDMYMYICPSCVAEHQTSSNGQHWSGNCLNIRSRSGDWESNHHTRLNNFILSLNKFFLFPNKFFVLLE